MNGKVSGNVNWLMELRAESQMHTQCVCAFVCGMRVCPAPLPFIFHFFKSTFRCVQPFFYTFYSPLLAACSHCTHCRTLFLSLLLKHSILKVFFFSSLFRFQNLYIRLSFFSSSSFVSLVVIWILKSFLNSHSFSLSPSPSRCLCALRRDGILWCGCEWVIDSICLSFE